MLNMKKTSLAFSLVELSIVLVILGLLVGGILSGQSLIRAAELRAVTAEYQRYLTAVNSFRDKYFAIPGDMDNATSVWGKDNTYCAGHTGTAATPGTCNGDGNGYLSTASGATSTGEIFRFWQQLALAGLIEGNYTGISGTAGDASIARVNVPVSKLSSGVWGMQGAASPYAGDANAYAYDYGNTFLFGKEVAGWWALGAVLGPVELMNIDTKIDDGKPASGKVLPYYWANCTTSASKTDYTGTYKLTDTTKKCAAYFVKSF